MAFVEDLQMELSNSLETTYDEKIQYKIDNKTS